MLNTIFIKNGVMIVLVLTIAFLSQQPYFKTSSKLFTFPFLKKGESYVSKTYDSLKNDISSKFNGEVVNISDPIEYAKEEIINQKNNLEKNSTTAVKNFIAQKVLQTLGVKPQDLIGTQNSSCPK